MNQLQRVVVALSLLLLLPCYAAAQRQKEEPREDGLGVEITSDEGTKVTLHVLASDPTPENLSGTIRVPGSQGARTQAGETIYGFRFVPHLENDALRVEVLALVGGREQAVASYLAKRGETVRLSEMAQFGVKPFELKIVSAKTIPSPAAVSGEYRTTAPDYRPERN